MYKDKGLLWDSKKVLLLEIHEMKRNELKN